MILKVANCSVRMNAKPTIDAVFCQLVLSLASFYYFKSYLEVSEVSLVYDIYTIHTSSNTLK